MKRCDGLTATAQSKIEVQSGFLHLPNTAKSAFTVAAESVYRSPSTMALQLALPTPKRDTPIFTYISAVA